MDNASEQILRRRMHGLYLSRKCNDIERLSRELLGMHCWFHRNVAFSALIRGAGLMGWKNVLTKTWIYRGTLHGVVFEDLPTLLALHSNTPFWMEQYIDSEKINEIADRIVSLMEDGVYSRAEMRRIFAYDYDQEIIDMALSSWGGIFGLLARQGKVAFRDMTSRDFDLISAEPAHTSEEVLPDLFRRYITAYGPATLDDAAWFFGFLKERKRELPSLNLDEYSRFEHNKSVFYYIDSSEEMGDIPALTLLSGFDPVIVSYTDRSTILPDEYKSAVIMKSGICLPTIAVNGHIAGIWNIKKGEPVIEFFEAQPKQIRNDAFDMVHSICLQTRYQL